MRYMVVLWMVAALGAGCSGDRPPEVPAGAPAAAAEPARGIAAPAEAELHGAPAPGAEDLRELYDVARDLQAVALAESGAVDDLHQDLARFASPDRPGSDPNAIVDGLGRALQGRTLDETTARRLAVLLYVAMNAGEITPAQRTAASAQMKELLTAIGTPGAQADAVAAFLR